MIGFEPETSSAWNQHICQLCHNVSNNAEAVNKNSLEITEKYTWWMLRRIALVPTTNEWIGICLVLTKSEKGYFGIRIKVLIFSVLLLINFDYFLLKLFGTPLTRNDSISLSLFINEYQVASVRRWTDY